MEYVDFDFYKNQFAGELVPANIFPKLEVRARNFINKITFGRIDPKNITVDIKMSVCAVVEKTFNIENDGGIKVSETVSKHSITYAISQNETIEKLLYKEAAIYLPGELLYRFIEPKV